MQVSDPSPALIEARRRRRLANSRTVEQLAVLGVFDVEAFGSEEVEDVARLFGRGVGAGGRLMMLSTRPRIAALEAMLRRDGASELQDTLESVDDHKVDDALQRMLDLFIRQDEADVAGLTEDELVAGLKVWRWASEAVARAEVTDTVGPVFHFDELQGLLARFVVTRAVRKLSDAGCIARDNELEKLHAYVTEPGLPGSNLIDDPAMVVYGIGGVGKSTLMARFVMNIVESEEPRRAWAYLDMDRPTLRDYGPGPILDEIVRQIAAQMTGGRRLLEGWRRRAGRLAKGEGLESLGVGSTYELLGEIASFVNKSAEGRLVVVLDTFEEVERADPGKRVAIHDLFVDLGEAVGELKLIVAGRAPAEPFARTEKEWERRVLHVKNLEGDAASELLRFFMKDTDVALDDEFARDVIATVGGNPLTLKLAADVLAAEGPVGFEEVAREATVDRVRTEFIGGFLYRRILDHIKASDRSATGQLQEVAGAALVLRRITEPLLAEVVLPVLDVADGYGADWFYNELQDEVAYATDEGDHLLLREELRGPALRALAYDDSELVDSVHRRASDFYGRRLDEPGAEEEYAYHQLALGHPLADLRLDDEQLRRVARSADTLPEGATAKIRELLSDDDLDMTAERELLDWERRTESKVNAELRDGRYVQAEALLAERSDRSPSSVLFRLESRLHEGRENLLAALHAARHDAGGAQLSGDRRRYAAAALRIAALQERGADGPPQTALATLQMAVDAPLLAGDRALRLELHLNRIAAAERIDKLDEDTRWFAELDARALLAKIPDAVLADNTALVRLLAATLGRDQLSYLIEAIGSIGVVGPIEDPARLRLLAAAIAEWDRDREEPGSLATQVGVPTAGEQAARPFARLRRLLAGAPATGENAWGAALAGQEAGAWLGGLLAQELPPAAVREALRAVYLWWGLPATEGHAETGGVHFLDELPLDWTRSETRELHAIIVDGYFESASMLTLASKTGLPMESFDLSSSPDHLARSIMEEAARRGQLRALVDVMQKDESLGTLRSRTRDLAAPWSGSFNVDGKAGGSIGLWQVDRHIFELRSSIEYVGSETGLEGRVSEKVTARIRTLDPMADGSYVTDLASVPGPTRWFLGTYGTHTPAALIHDSLIPTPEELSTQGMRDEYADRYLRFMLKDLGVRWIKRWVMWAAVAMRTRWAAGGLKKLLVVWWTIAAIAGVWITTTGAIDGEWGRIGIGLGVLLVPSVLWGKQVGAGIIAGIVAPWLLPPTILAVIGLGIYLVLELVLGAIFGRVFGVERRNSDRQEPRPPGPWQYSFTIDGVAGGPLKLRQTGKKSFVLQSEIHYGGDTGLEGKIDDETMEDIRTLPASITTDLASVPGPLRWFLGSYGAHTPAVLIHDRLIPTPSELQGKMSDQYADRYLRFMAKDVGMRWLKRWVMWSGVALRTRWAGGGLRKLSVVLWVVAAVVGMTTFANAAVNGDVGRMLLATLAIFVFAGLWDRQYGAGVIGGITASWLLPPAILAVIGLGIYVFFEFTFGWVWGRFGKPEVRGSGSYHAEGL